MGTAMNDIRKIEALERTLKAIDERIEDVEKRLPAHSVKPPIMTELFELEDEREAVLKQLEALKRADLNN